jgi:hypothetical protein
MRNGTWILSLCLPLTMTNLGCGSSSGGDDDAGDMDVAPEAQVDGGRDAAPKDASHIIHEEGSMTMLIE